MKRIVVAACVAAMVFSLSACGEQQDAAEIDNATIEDLQKENTELKNQIGELEKRLAEAPSPAAAPDDASFVAETSGVCGADLSWEYGNGILKIHGTGEMADFSAYKKDRPWEDITEKINHVYVDDGCTYIGEDAFSEFSVLSKVVLPDSVTKTGECFVGFNENVRKIVWGDDEYDISDPKDVDELLRIEASINSDGHQTDAMWGSLPAEAAPVS